LGKKAGFQMMSILLCDWFQTVYLLELIPCRFSLTGSFQDYIRISFSFYDINVLVEAAESIAKVVNNISQEK